MAHGHPTYPLGCDSTKRVSREESNRPGSKTAGWMIRRTMIRLEFVYTAGKGTGVYLRRMGLEYFVSDT